MELYEKPKLEDLSEDEWPDAILEYHKRIVEAPVLYEKDRGPQECVDGLWLGGDLPTLEQALEFSYEPHEVQIDEPDDEEFDLEHVEALIRGEDPEPHTSRLNRALRWIWPLIGEMPYGWWTSGAVPAGAPAYGENARLPDRSVLKKRTVFCAGVCNLLLRSVGKRIPTAGNPLYDGGTYAYGVYFRKYSMPYSLSRVQPGDLLLDHYQSSAHQGHVGVVLNGKVFLQSFDGNRYMEGGHNGPGMNKIYTVADSTTAWNPDVIIRRQNWIDYKGDQPGFKAVA